MVTLDYSSLLHLKRDEYDEMMRMTMRMMMRMMMMMMMMMSR